MEIFRQKVAVPRKGNEMNSRCLQTSFQTINGVSTRDKLLAPDVAVESVMANGIDELELTTSYRTNLEDTPRSAEYTEKSYSKTCRCPLAVFFFFCLKYNDFFPICLILETYAIRLLFNFFFMEHIYFCQKSDVVQQTKLSKRKPTWYLWHPTGSCLAEEFPLWRQCLGVVQRSHANVAELIFGSLLLILSAHVGLRIRSIRLTPYSKIKLPQLSQNSR